MRFDGVTIGLLVSAGLLLAPAAGEAQSAPDFGRPFEPAPLSEARYAIRPPAEAPQLQRHYVKAADGVDIYVETWLPKATDGHAPPESLPTIVVVTPYGQQGRAEYAEEQVIEHLVPYGYAFAQMHVRGTGESGGCLEFIGAREADDAARVIEYLGRDAPWASGAVGAIGLSYNGGTIIAAAAGGDPELTRYLKAIVPLAPAATIYDLGYFDGVPHLGYDLGSSPIFTAAFSLPPGNETTLERYLEKDDCQPGVLLGSANPNGDFTAFAEEREWRRYVERIRAATLMVHGHPDGANVSLIQAGLFDHLPKSTPKSGLFGFWWHEFPGHHDSGVRHEWERMDFMPMVRAWFDHHVKGQESGVEDWPTAQVQGSDGQWRSEPDWPATGGPAGQLALGPQGRLGEARPSGSTAYREVSLPGLDVPGGSASFSTVPLPDRLEITGQPVLEAWVSLDRPDAHLAATIEALDADGRAIPYARTAGFRSLQHLDPLTANRFTQRHGRPAPTHTPVRVLLRFSPTDIVVPPGGRLRLRVSGSESAVDPLKLVTGEDVPLAWPSQPSGAATGVTLLHDCRHASVLRFVTARPDPDLLNVRERDEAEAGPLPAVAPEDLPVSDAGGLVRERVCGKRPSRLPQFGEPLQRR